MTTRDDDVVVVAVSGEVDIYTAGALRTALDQRIASGSHKLVVDLDGLDFLDSTGLGVLVGRLKLVRLRDGWIRIVCTQDRILRLFQITGLDQVFPIHPSTSSALSA